VSKDKRKTEEISKLNLILVFIINKFIKKFSSHDDNISYTIIIPVFFTENEKISKIPRF